MWRQKSPAYREVDRACFRQHPSARSKEDTKNRQKVNDSSPHDLDFVDDLPHAFHTNDRLLGKLLEVEVRHLSSKEQASLIELAPESLLSWTSLMKDSVLGRIGSLLCLGPVGGTHSRCELLPLPDVREDADGFCLPVQAGR